MRDVPAEQPGWRHRPSLPLQGAQQVSGGGIEALLCPALQAAASTLGELARKGRALHSQKFLPLKNVCLWKD